MTYSLFHSTRTYPKLPYEAMKQAILGKNYSLSLIFIGKKRAHTLNVTHRQATYVPNVLSFPLDTHVGEIYITPLVAQKECKKFSMSHDGYIGYLFIHGLLHLKGYPHGATMERLEKKYCKRFNLH